MPEICEAQSAVNQLNVIFWGHTVVEVKASSRFADADDRLIGWTSTGVSRRGKSILFEFENLGAGSLFIFSRLGAKGSWRLLKNMEPKGEHFIRLRLQGPSGKIIVGFDTTAKDATVELGAFERDFAALKMMGPDILSDQFNELWLFACLRRHAIPVKAILMRSEYFPGIGNWVASEALFRARINPLTPGSDITEAQAARIVTALLLTVKNGIALGGADPWVNPDGSKGAAHNNFAVYARSEKLCYFCGTQVKKIKVLGRATFVCFTCQSGNEPAPVSPEFVSQILKSTEGLNQTCLKSSPQKSNAPSNTSLKKAT